MTHTQHRRPESPRTSPPESPPESSRERPLERVLARDLGSRPDGEPAVLAGWVHRRRMLASVTFLVLRDRTGLAQVVVKDPATIEQVRALPEETVVEVSGLVRHSATAPGGAELIEPVIGALTEPAVPPPVELWRPRFGAGLPTHLDHAAVTLRHPRHRAAWQLASASMRGFRETLGALDFTEIATPKLVGTATESGSTVFTVDYFGRPAYLAQSPQLYKQMLVGVFERVFEVGPVFRAEPHDTVRHLAQYTSMDAELGFIRDHRDVLAVLREAVAGMVRSIEAYAADAAALLGIALPRVPEQFPVIHFRDALARVGADPDEPDLSPAHERALGEWALAAYDSDFLAVEGYPMAKRPFYTHPEDGGDGEGGRWSKSFDLLFRGLELTTGGQRLHRPSDYVTAMERTGTDPALLGGYLDAFAHGMPPHGGFAIGLERWVARLTGAENVREVTLFPRDLHRLEP
ncbi:MAG: aspartate--tRNA(Asn) ligase [Terracoccus sp.]